VDRPGLFRAGRWYLSNNFGDPVAGRPSIPSFAFGDPDGTPVLGDWDGDGVDTPGTVQNGYWRLSNTFDGALAQGFPFGPPAEADDIPVAGDWDGDGKDTPGYRRQGTFHLSDTFGGPITHYIGYGLPGDSVVVGDWDGDRIDTPGFIRGNRWGVSNTTTSNAAPTSCAVCVNAISAYPEFNFGEAEAQYVVGDWDGNGTDTPGFRDKDGMWSLSNGFRGSENITPFRYGLPGDLIVAGKTSPVP